MTPLSPPIRVDLTAKNVATSRHLGVLADALLTSDLQRVVVSFGANATNGRVLSTFSKWIQRNDCLVRTRVRAFALVVPNFWMRIQFRLFFLLSQPVAPSTVHRTEAQALRWLSGST